jgi:hypothetical protein
VPLAPRLTIDQQELLAAIVVVNGWFVTGANFADMAMLHRHKLITTHDAQEGHVRADATAKGIRLARKHKLVKRIPPWTEYSFGPEAPQIKGREAA